MSICSTTLTIPSPCVIECSWCQHDAVRALFLNYDRKTFVGKQKIDGNDSRVILKEKVVRKPDWVEHLRDSTISWNMVVVVLFCGIHFVNFRWQLARIKWWDEWNLTEGNIKVCPVKGCKRFNTRPEVHLPAGQWVWTYSLSYNRSQVFNFRSLNTTVSYNLDISTNLIQMFRSSAGLWRTR